MRKEERIKAKKRICESCDRYFPVRISSKNLLCETCVTLNSWSRKNSFQSKNYFISKNIKMLYDYEKFIRGMNYY